MTDSTSKHTVQQLAADFISRYMRITETTVAKEIGRVRAGQWRYDPKGRGWYVWSGTHWEGDREALVADAVTGLCMMLSAAARAAGDITAQRVEKIQTSGFTGGVLRILRNHPLLHADQDDWDANPFLLGTPGGTVDLKTGEVRPARPQDYITKLTAVAPAPRGTPCPDWMKFIGQATEGSEEKQTFLQQWAGIGLSGDVSEQYFTNYYGPGGNGKSVFISVITRILGPYHCRADLDLFLATRNSKHPTGLMDMKGARMATCVELGEGRAWDTRAIKSMTGGDAQRARYMNKNFVTFQPTASITVVGDHMPNLESIGPAMRRRVLVLEFLYKPPEADVRKHLDTELFDAEGPAILRWMIDGCVDWQANGFTIPDCVRTATDEYFEDQDEVGAWIEEACEIDTRSKAKRKAEPWFTPIDALYGSLLSHCRGQGRSAGTKWALSARLKQDKRLKKDRSTAGRGFIGIRLRPFDLSSMAGMGRQFKAPGRRRAGRKRAKTSEKRAKTSENRQNE
jgi:putative DNA primase/helicase